MGKNKAMLSIGNQDFIVLGFISEKKTIDEIKEICVNFGKYGVRDAKVKLLKIGLIEKKPKRVNGEITFPKGLYRLTTNGKYFLNIGNKIMENKDD